MIPMAIAVTLVVLAILLALGWLILDNKQLRAKYEQDKDGFIQEIAALQRDVNELKRRAGI